MYSIILDVFGPEIALAMQVTPHHLPCLGEKGLP